MTHLPHHKCPTHMTRLYLSCHKYMTHLHLRVCICDMTNTDESCVSGMLRDVTSHILLRDVTSHIVERRHVTHIVERRHVTHIEKSLYACTSSPTAPTCSLSQRHVQSCHTCHVESFHKCQGATSPIRTSHVTNTNESCVSGMLRDGMSHI